MEGELISWLVKGTLAAVIGGLGIALRNLFSRMREAESGLAVLNREPGTSTTAEDLQTFKLRVAENYVRRDDYVQQLAGVLARLDGIGKVVVRVEERQKAFERHHGYRTD